MIANDPLWDIICSEARLTASQEPLMSGFFDAAILSHQSLAQALCFNLSQQLHSSVMSAAAISEVLAEAMDSDAAICDAARTDIRACFDRDPACDNHFMPILYFKGFQALQLYRVAHWLWL
ncbi:MAG: serine O-acetyltransferase, partial [Porticoccaceae bacterium]|nr:serine O-acetyltransferase [Porticoccaceae bacterium]